MNAITMATRRRSSGRLRPPPWHADAACKEHTGVTFFPDEGPERRSGRVTLPGCLVREECLADALADAHCEGVWGGTTSAERRRVKAQVRA